MTRHSLCAAAPCSGCPRLSTPVPRFLGEEQGACPREVCAPVCRGRVGSDRRVGADTALLPNAQRIGLELDPA